jgi:hypothetical protein
VTRLETGRVLHAERLGIGTPGLTEQSQPIHYALSLWGPSVHLAWRGAPGE